MNRKTNIRTVILLALLLGSYHAFSQTAEELLPKAIQLEEVKGELEQAIGVYQAIVNEYPDNRPVAAKAYFHMGICYEKLGRREAQNAYKMVLSNYADQDEIVKEAKARLAALGKAGSSDEDKGLMVRKVWEGAGVDLMGEPSPDGKYLSILDVNTGNWPFTRWLPGRNAFLPITVPDDPNQFAEHSRWSPDGNKLSMTGLMRTILDGSTFILSTCKALSRENCGAILKWNGCNVMTGLPMAK